MMRFSGSERPISGVLPRWGFLEAASLAHLWATTCSCRRHRRFEQVAQPDQVVGDHVQPKHRTHLVCAAQLELAQPAPLFDPAKHLLDAAAGIDRLGVARMAGGAAIDGGEEAPKTEAPKAAAPAAEAQAEAPAAEAAPAEEK